MIKKTERLLTAVLICLIAYLAYSLLKTGNEPDTFRGTAPYTINISGEEGQLPAYYDARAVQKNPCVQDQGTLGTCWAVSAAAALEAYFLPQEHFDFSADHLSLNNHFAKGQNDGGAYTMIMAYLAGWQGPVLEEDDPYGDGYSPEGLEAVKHVQEMRLFKKKDYDAMKQAIVRYGSVQSAVYMDLENSYSRSEYYNAAASAYRYDGTQKPNHDVLVIGWDDHYSASNFTPAAKADGAFICQNSWGRKFGDDGVFYVSYEDVNIGTNALAYTKIEGTDNYDNLYQTDLCGWVGQLGYGDSGCFAANVYEAPGPETLEAVGFYVTGENTEYELYFIEDFQDETSFFTKKPLQQGMIEEIGYYTVPLEKKILLESGQRYALVLEIHTPDALYPVATEYAADDATKTVDISDGEGYISHNGVVWTNTEQQHAANVCLKVYTNNAAVQTG